MALAEGLRPLFFRSVVASDFFERRLTGAMLHPFNGQLREVGITEIIWELATAFGSATLKTLDGVHKVTIAAIGDNLAWSPYQSHGDLLWADVSQTPDWPNQAQTNQAQSENSMNSQLGDTASIERRPAETARQDEDPQGPVRLQPRDATFERAAPQRFNVGSLFLVLDALDNEQILSEDQLMKLVGVKRREGIADYRRFLASAGAIETGDGDWKAKPLAQELTVALRNEDIPKLRACLKLAPSFGEWARQIEQQPLGEPCDSKGLGRAQRTYLTLAEVTQIGAPIFGKGFYPTPSMPDTAAFATIAIDRFDQLDRDEGLVATGAWLEALVQQDGIHPEVARNRLNDASASGLIRRTTEGSTTEVRFDKHVIQVLRIRNGIPIVLTVHLYRGDYLIPGKSSTSLRIERPLP